MACKGSDHDACETLGRAIGYRLGKQAPTSGRAHGGQVRAQEGLDRQIPLQPGRHNGQVIATSEAYESKASAINGID